MYTDTIEWDAFVRELKGFGAARVILIICALAPLVMLVVEILNKRLDLKRFAAGAAVCLPVYAVGGGLYAFIRGVGGAYNAGVFAAAWCAVIFAASCVFLALFKRHGELDGAVSFFLGISSFAVIANTVFSVMLVTAILLVRDPASPHTVASVGIRPLEYFCVYSTDYVDFIVSGIVKDVFMIFAVLAARKLNGSEKFRRFVPAVFAVSAAVCCFGRGIFFTVLDEFIRYTKGLFMPAFGVAVICALTPPVIFLFGRARGELKIKPFLKGLAIQAAVYACGFLLILLIDYILESSERDLSGISFGFACIFLLLGVSFALYSVVFRSCGDGRTACGVSLGISCLTLLMFVAFMLMFYYGHDHYHREFECFNGGFTAFMIVSAAITLAAAASAFEVKRLHSSERFAGKAAAYISSAMAAVVCFSVFCSEIALYS